jgi:hypothetical protein
MSDRLVAMVLVIWSGCGHGDGGPVDAPGALGSSATLSVTSALVQPPTSATRQLTILVTLAIDGCPTLDSSFGGTFRGVAFPTVTPGSFDGVCHPPMLLIAAAGGQPPDNVIEVHDHATTITATFADGVLDAREATAHDTMAWQFTQGGVVRYGWSHPADLVGSPAPALQWAGLMYPGSEVLPPHWVTSGAVSAGDELTFTVPSGSAYQHGSGGTAFITAGSRTGDATSCQGALACRYDLYNTASHSASSL